MSVNEFPLDFRRLFEMSPGAFLVLLPDLTIAEATDEYLRTVMRKREDIVGREVFEAFPDNPDDETVNSIQVKASFLKVFETGEPDELPLQKYDVQRPAEDGGGYEERYWRLVTFPGFNGKGEVAYIYQRVENITEQVRLQEKNAEQRKLNEELSDRAERSETARKQTADALEDVRLRLESALNAGEIGTWTWDPVNDKVVADKNLAKFFSVSEEVANGGKIENYLKAVHPDDLQIVEELIKVALGNKDSYEAEYRLINPDNSIRWVVARGRIVRDEKGDPIQLPGVVIDITSRKQTEEELIESQSRLALALQAGRAGTFVWDIKNNINIWSPELEEMYGVPIGTFEGDFSSWEKRVFPDDLEIVNKGIEKTLAEGKELYDYEFRVVLPNGSHKWLAGRAKFEYNAEGEPSRMLGINVDITDSKKVQELLVERTKLATLSSDVGIGLNRREDLGKLLGHCTDALVEHLNAAFARIWTVDKSGTMLQLQASSGLYTHLDGEHSLIPIGKFKIGKIAEERSPHLTNDISNDPQISDKDWAKDQNMQAFAGYPLIVEEKLVGVMCVFSQKTLTETAIQAMESVANTIANAIERKHIEKNLSESDERFKLITRATNDAIWDWNLQTNDVWWNNAVQTMFGYTKDQVEPKSTWWYQQIHPEDRERVVSGIHEVIDNGGENWSDEYRFLCSNGKYKYVFDRGFAIHRDGKAVRMLGAMQDVTDNKLIESEREQLLWNEKNARTEAEKANRMKDEFLATLSHELRTPLSAILGWSRLLKQGQIKEEQKIRAVETIERNAKIQTQLIEDVLDVSRIISGKMRLEVRPLDLATVIESAIDSVSPAIEAKNIRFQRVMDTKVMIAGDADRLQQIIWNLLSNAIKFTPKDGRVQIRMERVNSHVEITVEDNGIGIAPETLPFIFERFRQSDSSTTRKHGGLGLGLAIVRHLVELHGGTVHAMSKGLGEGSTFTLKFPQIAVRSKEVPKTKDEEQEDRIHPTVNGETGFVCPPEIKDLKVLLVDDERDTREMLTFIFETCEAFPVGCSSVEEALEAIKNNKFDILISDIGMPKRDGYDLIKSIRQLSFEEGGRLPAVALTAYARVEDRLRILSAGFQMHVVKPVDPSELLAVVASLINRNK